MSMIDNNTLAISAFGAVTPIGGNFSSISKSLREGLSGIKAIEKFNCNSFITQHAGLPDESNEIQLNRKRPKITEQVYSHLAAKRLLSHDQFPKSVYSEDRLGCILGVDEPAVDIKLCLSMKANSRQGEDKKSLLGQMLNHFKVSDCLNLEPSSVLNTIHKLIPFSGFSTTHVGLCSASLQAIGMGMQAIHSGQLDAVIVGGISGKVNPINLARLELMDVISTDLNLDPTKRSRPFDQKRSGFVLAEGAVLFVIEKRNNILQRGDKPLLNLLGYGASLGAEHIVAPHQNSLEMRLAMQRALDSARMSALEVDLINVHGTSTVLNDLHESQAINSVFGNDEVSVTANKSLHGHLIAAAGAMEVLNTLISTQEGFIPGSINCDHQDRQCKINLIKNTINETPNFILKNSFGMGGLAASMLLGRGDL